MRRHLLLRWQQQRLSLEARLLKTQPLVERNARQQALLPATLGLDAVPVLDTRGRGEARPWQLMPIDVEWAADSPLEVDPLAEIVRERPFLTTSPMPEMENEARQLLAENEAEQSSAETTTPAEPLSSAEPGETRLDLHVAPLPVSQRSTSAPASNARESLPSQEQPGSLALPVSETLTAAPVEIVRASLPSQEQPDLPALPVNETLISEPARTMPRTLPFQGSQEEPGSAGGQTLRSHVQEIQAQPDDLAPGTPGGANEVHNGIPSMRQKAGTREERKIQPRTNPATSASSGQSESMGNTEEIFAPRESDRSPQAWLARLTRQAQAEQAQVKNKPSPAQQERRPVQRQMEYRPAQRQPEPISQRARTFLKPLVGIDPGEVPIYRDAQAMQVNSELSADAFSTGETIEIAPGYSQEEPEALGLLAHELTHIARQRHPRFIPPVARPQVSAIGQASAPETLDEEALALHVEQRVRRVVRAIPEPNALDQEVITPGEPQREESAPGQTSAERGMWGNLPAPWEPLPDWLVSTPAPAPTPLVAPPLPAPAINWQAPGTGSGSTSPTHVETAIQRAGTERSIDDTGDESTAQNTPGPAPTQEPEQDLDALARQVYGLLKRRLSVEQRRGV